MQLQELNRLVSFMNANKLTIAFAESVTAGMLSYQFSKALEVSKVFQGSIVTYKESTKTKILMVQESTLQEFTPESPEVTYEMALGLKKLLNPDVAVATTGLANPGGSESPDKPVGTIFTCALYQGKRYDFRTFFSGSRDEIILQSASYVFERIKSIFNY